MADEVMVPDINSEACGRLTQTTLNLYGQYYQALFSSYATGADETFNTILANVVDLVWLPNEDKSYLRVKTVSSIEWPAYLSIYMWTSSDVFGARVYEYIGEKAIGTVDNTTYTCYVTDGCFVDAYIAGGAYYNICPAYASEEPGPVEPTGDGYLDYPGLEYFVSKLKKYIADALPGKRTLTKVEPTDGAVALTQLAGATDVVITQPVTHLELEKATESHIASTIWFTVESSCSLEMGEAEKVIGDIYQDMTIPAGAYRITTFDNVYTIMLISDYVEEEIPEPDPEPEPEPDWTDDDNVQLSLMVARTIANWYKADKGWTFCNGVESQYIGLPNYYAPASFTFESSTVYQMEMDQAHASYVGIIGVGEVNYSSWYSFGERIDTSGNFIAQILGYQYSYSSSKSTSLIAPYHLMFAFDENVELLEVTVMPGCANTDDYCASFYDIEYGVDTTNTSWVTKSNYVGNHKFNTHYLPPANTQEVVMMPLSYDPRVTKVSTTKARGVKATDIVMGPAAAMQVMSGKAVNNDK